MKSKLLGLLFFASLAFAGIWQFVNEPNCSQIYRHICPLDNFVGFASMVLVIFTATFWLMSQDTSQPAA